MVNFTSVKKIKIDGKGCLWSNPESIHDVLLNKNCNGRAMVLG